MSSDSFKLSESDFQTYLERTPDGILAATWQGEILFVNPAFVKQMRAKSASLYEGRSVLDFVAPEERARIAESIRNDDPRQPSALSDVIFIRADGTRAICETAGRRMGGDDDELVGIYVVRDVTEQREQMEQLRRANEERALMFESGPVAVTLTDTEGRYLHANRAMTELIGYSEAELRERTYLDLTHPADRMNEVKALRSLWKGEPHARIDKRLLRRNSEVVEVSAHLTLLRDAAGEPRGYIAHTVDNTAELRAAAALRRTEEQFRALFSESQIGMGLMPLGEGRGFFQRVNPALCALFGYSEEEMLTQPIQSFVDPIDRYKAFGALDPEQLLAGAEYEHDLRYLGKHGRKFEGERHISIIPDASGKPAAAVVQILDVTALKSAERELARDEELHQLVVANMPRVVMFVYDLGYRYTQVEGGPLLADLNLAPESMLGKSPHDLAEAEIADVFVQNYARGLGDKVWSWDFAINGRMFVGHSTSMRDEEGKLVGGMTLFYDSTPDGRS